jgi:hypothetical protein
MHFKSAFWAARGSDGGVDAIGGDGQRQTIKHGSNTGSNFNKIGAHILRCEPLCIIPLQAANQAANQYAKNTCSKKAGHIAVI